ncbi:hypothetical protein [Sphingobacterium paludis]|uniref:Uncharacterized protein n=1 Tax=Sphingobacterium paludis TaxID=1476465 RepID=A0A4R7CV91_9SPHI|nr:hypothetical protein [Sphingobacterium paludis]TDS08959.1 hypothetical protein B0I21_11188 [Sphingobacterium paludis]
MDTVSIVLFNAAITSIVHLAFRSYFTGYLQKKAENQASKEDIAELTSKVEQAKSSFQKNLEIFKSEVNLQANLRGSHRGEEKNALIDFHGKLNDWIQRLFAIDIHQAKLMTSIEIQQLRREIDSFPHLSVALSKVRLLVLDTEIVQESRNILQIAVDYKSQVEKVLMGLQFAVDEKNNLYQQSLRYEPKDFSTDLHPEFERLGLETDRMIKKINALCDDYWQQGRIVFFLPVRDMDNQYVDKVKKYLSRA